MLSKALHVLLYQINASFSAPVRVEVYRDRISVLDLETEECVQLGPDSYQGPYSSPTQLVADPEVAAQYLAKALAQLRPGLRRFFPPAAVFIQAMHDDCEFCPAVNRQFNELANSTLTGFVVVHCGSAQVGPETCRYMIETRLRGLAVEPTPLAAA